MFSIKKFIIVFLRFISNLTEKSYNKNVEIG